jgi:hypothetical protein
MLASFFMRHLHAPMQTEMKNAPAARQRKWKRRGSAAKSHVAPVFRLSRINATQRFLAR